MSKDGLLAAVPARARGNTARVVGLCGWTRVTTNFGEVPAGLLRVRDVLRTVQGDFLPVLRIDRVTLDAGFLTYHPEARPVLIPAGALGRGRPAAEAVFAPDQPVGLPRQGDDRVLRPREMVGHAGVTWANVEDVSYFVIDCGRPVEILSEGLRARL